MQILLPDDSTSLGFWLLNNTDYFEFKENNKACLKLSVWFCFSLVLTLFQLFVLNIVVNGFFENLKDSQLLQEKAKSMDKQAYFIQMVNSTDLSDIDDSYKRGNID